MTYEEAVEKVGAPVIIVHGEHHAMVAKAICKMFDTISESYTEDGKESSVIYCNSAVEKAICFDDETLQKTCDELEGVAGCTVHPDPNDFEF